MLFNINTMDNTNSKESIFSEYQNANIANFNNIPNIDTIDDTSKLVGLLTHTDTSKIPNSTSKGSFFCYKVAEDFTIELSRSQVLNDFIEVIIVNNNTYFQWKQTEESNYKMIQLLINNKNFSPLIAVAIKKTHKDFYSKMLKLDLYYQGCHGNRNKDRTTFSIEISKQELLLEKEIIHIIVKFNKKKNICFHE